MNNKSGSERDQLLDTLKLAASCNLNVFETADAILHEFKFHDLQKLCEEAKQLVDSVKTNYLKERASLESQLAEQKVGLARLQSKFDWTVGDWRQEEVLWKEREANLQSQIATQTERIKELEHRAEVCQKFHGDVVDQTERIRELENKIEAMEYDAKEELPE